MAKCLKCGNTTNFNVWCTVSKVLEVEINEKEEMVAVMGEPEDSELKNSEEVWVMEDDLEFSLVGCAWCGSDQVELEGFRIQTLGSKFDE